MPRRHGAIIVGPVARVTIFGAGAMGTAFAMHAARLGLDTALWANPHDARVLTALRTEGKHPLLPEHLPAGVAVFPPEGLEKAAAGVQIAVMGANSHGARSLAKMVADAAREAEVVVSVAKGLEPESGMRISEVYARELRAEVVAVGGPCLASELAEGLPTAAVWASREVSVARGAGEPFAASAAYQITYTDDVAGVELCSMVKNVAAIGLGFLDGIGKPTQEDFKNAKAALFTKAAHELSELVTALGGRAETALGLAGLGDALVTSLGGRNRLYGELVGAGTEPRAAHEEMEGRGMTVEGVDSTRDVRRLAGEAGLDLPYHLAIYRVLFEGADPRHVLEVLR
jgi:glycerol-3-phosphate dehydrogenase (NAD(P)+)